MYSMCTSFISLGLSVQSAPVPEMTRLQRHNSTNMSEIKRNSFHVARINLTGYPPCTTPLPPWCCLVRCMSDANVQPGHAQRMCGMKMETDMLWMWPCVVHFVHFTMPARRGQEMSICLAVFVIPRSFLSLSLPLSSCLEIFQIFALDSH